jgi:protein-tyrosine phosphatase
MDERILAWNGCYNVRDLGGLPIAGGGTTRFHAIVRSAAPYLLTARGWAAARDHGIRTVIDLMNPDELEPDRDPRPADIVTVRVPLDNTHDRGFWDPMVESGHWGTALYSQPFRDRFAGTVATAIAAIATAGPGGVLVHCGRGQDRAGMIAMVVLALAGVDVDAIADDYDLSRSPATVRRRAELGHPDDNAAIQRILTRAGTSNHAAIRAVLAGTDIRAYLLAAGARPADLDSVRQRLTDC